MTQSQFQPYPFIAELEQEWQEKYYYLFERHELFMIKLCKTLNIPYETSDENEVLITLEKALNPLVIKEIP